MTSTPATADDRLPLEQLKGPMWFRRFARWLGLPAVALTFAIVAVVVFVSALVWRLAAPDQSAALVGESLPDPRVLAIGCGLLATAGLQAYNAQRVPKGAFIAGVMGILVVLGTLIWIAVAWIGSLFG